MNTNSYGIYRIVSPDGFCYIGMTTVSFSERWKGHLKLLRKGNHHCSSLSRSYEKYGEELLFEVLEDMTGSDQKAILLREKYWWLLHKPWLNLHNGEPSGKGSVKHTEETRRKISAKFNSRKAIPLEKVCVVCGKNFATRKKSVKTCSLSCRSSLSGGNVMRKVTKEALNELYFSEGLSLAEIGKIYGVSHVSIHNRMKTLGLSRRKQGGH